MEILWKYLKPQRWLIVVSLALAGISQLLSLVDPLIFGKIIDDYATRSDTLAEEVLVKGVLRWLAVAIAIALLARAAKSFQEYFTRLENSAAGKRCRYCRKSETTLSNSCTPLSAFYFHPSSASDF